VVKKNELLGAYDLDFPFSLCHFKCSFFFSIFYFVLIIQYASNDDINNVKLEIMSYLNFLT